MENMNQSYYTLDNGLSAVNYIYAFNLGFAYGNAFKYLVRASRKPGNSAESDLNKAITYVLSANNEIGFVERMLKKLYNTWKFNDRTQFATRSLADILCAIIKFDSPKSIAKLIIKYMQARDIKVKDEFIKYA